MAPLNNIAISRQDWRLLTQESFFSANFVKTVTTTTKVAKTVGYFINKLFNNSD